MPEVALSEPSEALDCMDLWWQVMSFMVYPDDEMGRHTFLAGNFAVALGELERLPRDLKRDPACWEAAQLSCRSHLMEHFDWFGGFRSLLEPGGAKPGRSNHRKQFNAVQWPRPNERHYWLVREWVTVAHILCFVRAIHASGGEASIRKAVFLTEECKGRNGLLRNRNHINDAWQNYKNISHLAAALFFCLTRLNFDFNLLYLGVLLTVARQFQDFGTKFVPLGQSKPVPILDTHKIWVVPDDLAPNYDKCDTSPLWKLDEEGIEALKRYPADLKASKGGV
jgi:hypothetical protein